MESNNPYEAPASFAVDAQRDTTRPLFRTGAIYIATFMGSTLAGGWVLAMNHEALGQPGLARKARWSGLVASLALMALSFLLPWQIPGVAYLVPQLLAVSQWLKKTPQGDAIAVRLAAGLPMRSNWAAAGIGLLCGLAQLAALGLIALTAIYGFGVEL
ncbi:hypothetical protein [Lysobacter enzymogenes]|uniref:hypothetical protein n=1 Tax=Lysobacter enzymogenes TaxID=69 RepID=UPI001A97C9E9|nr:hypothetical protein [Lysobacter enzymogenes]QQP95290.1 hypothetical protein JHW38_18910 [Lysobacter enzymogenes]